MASLNISEQLVIFSRYIGQQVVIINLFNGDETIGTLIGLRQNAIFVAEDDINRWIPLNDNFRICDIKLLLKPLKKLTSAIIDTANTLPVQAFITPYYQQLGFDMPVFISPGHHANCKYVHELGLADYRPAAEILQADRRVALAGS
jgi:hypothetical protein